MKGTEKGCVVNVVIEIQGREAIPVRAIPLLTNWNLFSPDVVATVLTGDKSQRRFLSGELQAFHLESDQVLPLKTDWWEVWAAQDMCALSEKIKMAALPRELSS